MASHRWIEVWAGLMALVAATPGYAQVSGDITLQSDYRLRGHSISSGDPVAMLDLSYDHPSGLYLNGSVIGVLREGDAALLETVGGIGYAKRLTPTLSLDGGFSRTEYRDAYGLDYPVDYNEVYVGLYGRNVSGHLYYSPDYYYRGVRTLYGELETSKELTNKLRLSAHGGVLDYVDMPAGWPRPKTQYDWRLAASRQLGPVDFRAALTGGGPGPDYYEYRAHKRTAVVVSATWTF